MPWMLILAVAACGAADCHVLRTAAETREHAERAADTNAYRFVLRGMVMSWVAADSFILKDETGSIWLRLPAGDRVSPGDLLEVRGHGVPNFAGHRTPQIDSFVRLGDGTPPPPAEIDLRRLDAEDRRKLSYQTVRTSGIVINVFHDEIDPRFNHLAIRSGASTLHASVPAEQTTTAGLERLLGAEVRITGTFMFHQGGRRLFSGSTVYISDAARIEPIRYAGDLARDAPMLENESHMDPALIVATGLRRVDGVVAAAWHGDRLLLRTDDGRCVTVSLMDSRSLPSCGMRATAIGFPDTDLFHVNLIYACVVDATPAASSREDPSTASLASLLSDGSRRRFDVSRHGQMIRVSGTVVDMPSVDGRVSLRDGDFTLPIDASACPGLTGRLKAGSVVEATGVCIAETDSWRPNAIVPQVKGLALVVRSPEDVRIVSGPPWLTVGRLSVAVVALLAFLLFAMAWNRTLNAMVARRSRQLAKEQVARTMSQFKVRERTRLAVELHDALSQNLAAVACLAGTARRAVRPGSEDALASLRTAERMLESCRTELKYCLFDLRSDILEKPRFSDAIRATLDQLQIDAEMAVRFDVPRTRLTDTTAHAILCTIRELVSNAVRHGKADSIQVAGCIDGDTLRFSVRDDGKGFDPATCPGPKDGHFGLQGIRERIAALNGETRIESSPGKGTKVSVSIRTKAGQA